MLGRDNPWLEHPWQATAVGLGIVAVVLVALALMLVGSGARLVGYDETLVGKGPGSLSGGATWLGAILLLFAVAHAALSLQPPAWKILDRALSQLHVRLFTQYGLDLHVLHARLPALLPHEASQRLARESLRMEVALTAWWAYLVAGALGAVLLAFSRGWPGVLALVPLTAFVLASRRRLDVVPATQRYADTYGALVERHRFDLLRALRQELPSSSVEERAVNQHVAKFLRGDEEAFGTFAREERDEPTGGTDLVYQHPPEVETAELGGEIRELREALADPKLSNWSGAINVRFEDAAEPQATLIAGRPSRATVSFSREPIEGWESSRIHITDGQDYPTSEFRVAFDSDAAEFPLADIVVAVARGGEEARAHVSFIAPGEPGEHLVWMSVFQGTRLVESLETALVVRAGLT